MNVRTIIQNHWKGILIAGLAFLAGIYGGPLASKAVTFVAPALFDHVSNTPIEDLAAHKNPLRGAQHSERSAPPSALPGTPHVSTPLRARLYRATLAQVAKDFGIVGSLDCRVVQP